MRHSQNPIDGTKLARIRDRQGLTTRALAAKAGISDAHMGRIERNLRGPSPHVRNRILDALGITLDDLTPDTTLAA